MTSTTGAARIAIAALASLLLAGFMGRAVLAEADQMMGGNLSPDMIVSGNTPDLPSLGGADGDEPLFKIRKPVQPLARFRP